MIDTGDTILHRPTGLRLQVACVHEGYLHTLGYPDRKLLLESCELIASASANERIAVLVSLASSSSNNHRPRCARMRISAAADREGEILRVDRLDSR